MSARDGGEDEADAGCNVSPYTAAGSSKRGRQEASAVGNILPHKWLRSQRTSLGHGGMFEVTSRSRRG